MKKGKRILAFLLTLTMLLTMIPLSTFAVGEEKSAVTDEITAEVSLSEKLSTTFAEVKESVQSFFQNSIEKVKTGFAGVKEKFVAKPLSDETFTSGDYKYRILNDGTAEITDYTGSAKDLEILSKIDGYTVTSIGQDAFAHCSSLTSVIIPDSVTSIGYYAFAYCSSLTSINIPDSVTSIGHYAFSGCTSLTGINIPNGVTYISEYAFSGCSSLTSINIPDGVTGIGNDAFAYCSSLTSINIPDSVTSIGWDVFSGCTSLTSITIPDSVTSMDGSIFSGCTSLTSITIPDGVTSIGGGTFDGCTSLANIIIPNSVTSIGLLAFQDCTSLTSITIPDSVTSIEGYAFNNCSSLTSITIPDSVTSIEGSAFNNCSSMTGIIVDSGNVRYSDINGVLFDKNHTEILKYPIGKKGVSYTIPDSVTSIGDYAFSSCTSLINITIPDGVTDIGIWAFAGCTSLTSINIPDGVTSIGGYAFGDCSSLTSITIPDSVTSIGDSAFTHCSSLTGITIPDSVTSLGWGAFRECSGFKEVIIGNGVTSLNGFDFRGNENLENVVIGNSVTSIGYEAFYSCTSLTSITIPDSVTSIDYGAFDGCSSLTSITLPDGVTSILGTTFDGCTSLANIIIPDSVTSLGWGAFRDCTSLTSINIPDGVTSIGQYAFYGCTSLTSINIPDSVTKIDESTFYGCSSLTGITIPDSVTSIGDSAFTHCSSLTGITIPDSVTSIERYAFRGCQGFKDVIIGNGVTSLNGFDFEDNKNLESVVIGNSVTSIGNDAFKSCSALSNITIPDSVTSIGYNAFYGCTSLTSITIPDSVTSIGNFAFWGCKGLKNIIIGNGVTSLNGFGFYENLESVVIGNSVTSIGDADFKNCSALSNITIPDSVTSIGREAFSGCTSLTSITIPDSVTSMDGGIFSGCTSLTSITIPNSVTSIGGGTFDGCTSLANIIIPDSVTSIDDYAFRDCVSLASITIPDSVTSIGHDAFSGCKSLKYIYFGGTKEQWNSVDKTDARIPDNTKIHYNSTGPEETPNLSDYRIGTVEDAWYGANGLSEVWVKIDGTTYLVGDVSIPIYPDYIKGQRIAFCLDEKNRLAKYTQVSEFSTGKVTNYDSVNHKFTVAGELSELHIYIADGITDPKVLENANSMVGKTIRYTTVSLYSNTNTLGWSEKYLVDVGIMETHVGKIKSLDVHSNPWQVYLDGESAPIPVNMADESLQNQLTALQQKEAVLTLIDGEICFAYDLDLLITIYCAASVDQPLIWQDKKYQQDSVKVRGTVSCSIDSFTGDYDVVRNYLNGRTVRTVKELTFSAQNADMLEKGTIELKPNVALSVDDSQTFTAEFKVKHKLFPKAPEDEITTKAIGVAFVGDGWSQSKMASLKIRNEDLIAENEKKRQEEEKKRQEEADKAKKEAEAAAKKTAKALKSFKKHHDQNLPETARNCIALPADVEQYLTENEAQALRVAIVTEIALATYGKPKTFREKMKEYDVSKDISDKVFDKLMKAAYGNWQPDISAKKMTIIVSERIDTKKYGKVTVRLRCVIQNFDVKDHVYGTFGEIYKEEMVVEKGKKGGIAVPGDGVISIASFKEFVEGAIEVAVDEISDVWDKKPETEKEYLDNLVEAIYPLYFCESMRDIIEEVLGEDASEVCIERIKNEVGKDIRVHCPVNLYLYNESGELAGSIVNDQALSLDDNLILWTEGESKHIRILDGTYSIIYEARDDGEMKVEVVERNTRDTELRAVTFENVPLVKGNLYTNTVDTSVSAEYTLTSGNGEILEPDVIVEKLPNEPLVPPEIPELPDVTLGDVNLDGVVNAADAVLIQRYEVGLIELTPEQLEVADTNGDGEVTAADAVLICRVDAGIISKLVKSVKNKLKEVFSI